MIGRGHGKVILCGEHAVVYGHAALAGALALGVECRAERAAKSRLVVEAWGIDTAKDPDGAPARALAAIADALGGGGAWEIVGEATVPSRAGLGSSAALGVAIARSLGARTDEDVERVAAAGERVFHRNPSGVDVALATRGGVGLYRRASGLTPIAGAKAFRIAIGLSGEPRDTGARVADVARRREADREHVDEDLARLGALAERGAEIVRRGEPASLGAIFDDAHVVLTRLGLSTARLDRLAEIARGAGATGAKLTGAGGGGAVIAAGEEERLAAVEEAWRTAGFAAMLVTVGGG
jgi:mevalonate kinase